MLRSVRTGFLLLVVVSFLLSPWAGTLPAEAAEPDVYDGLRSKWVELLTGGTGFDTEDPDVASQLRMMENAVHDGTRGYWADMKTGADREACGCLWSDLAELKSDNIVLLYGRLRAMALAFATEGSRFKDDPALLQAIMDGLEWMDRNRYNTTVERYGNWYHWEMSGPQNLLDTAVLVYSHLPEERLERYMSAVARFAPDPNQTNGAAATGANRAEKVWVFMLRAVLVNHGAELALARDALSDRTGTPTSSGGLYNVFAYTAQPEADGMHEDGSYLFHGPHPYIGNYGTTFFQLVANVLYLLHGTPWQIQDPEAQNVYRWVYESFAPTLYKGGQMDMVRGRLISNPGVQSHTAGHRVIQGVIMTAMMAPPEHAARLQGMVKAWVLEDTYRSFLGNAPLFFALKAKALVADPSVAPEGERTGNKLYTQSDRVVHHRPGFAYGIAMSSARVYRYESINGNNLKGWRAGDGVTYLYDGDLAQYDDHYWATVDMYRLPGITGDRRTLSPAAGQSTKTPHTWVGGASDGLYGAAGMQFTPYGTSLTGKKSWFLFDNEIVALGAGITSASGAPVETVIENRKLGESSASRPLTVGGTVQPTEPAQEEVRYKDAQWAHLSGGETGPGTGYLFPGGAEVIGLREARTGSWGEVQGGTPTEPITRDYQTLWFEHGVNPVNASYQYAVLPRASSEETGQYARNPDFEVLANTPEVQAVREHKLRLTGANFWENTGDAPVTVKVQGEPWLSSRSKASVLVRENGGEVTVSVADPTQRQTGPIELEWHRPAVGVIGTAPGITVRQLSPTVRLSVDLNGAKGATRSITLRTEALAGDSVPPSVPEGLTASAASSRSIKLQWEPSTDRSGVAGYRVYRFGTLIATVNSPGYTDTGLAAGTEYGYAVSAFDPAGNVSPLSAVVAAKTLDDNPYLIRDTFDAAPVGQPPEGYEVDAAGAGTVTVEAVKNAADKSLKLHDTSGSRTVVASKPIGVQTGPVLLEFDVMLPVKSDYHSWNLKGEDGTNAVTLMTSGGNLIYKNAAGGDSALMPYQANTWYRIKLAADPSRNAVNIHVDGILRASGVPFRNRTASLARFDASTGVSSTGTHYLDRVTAFLFDSFAEETFDTEAPGNMPSGYVWNGAGTVEIAEAPGAPDRSLRISGDDPSREAGPGVELYRSFPSEHGLVGLEFDAYLTESSGGVRWTLGDSSGAAAVTVAVYGGGLAAEQPGVERKPLGEYRHNGWHRLKLMVNGPEGTASIYVDGAAKAVDIPLAAAGAVSRFTVTTDGRSPGDHYLDNVRIFPYEYLIDDPFDDQAVGASPAAYTIELGYSANSVKIDDFPGGGNRSLKFSDTTSRAAVATKSFPARTEPVVAEFDVLLPALEPYHSWNLKDEAGTNGVTVMTSVINGRHVFVYKDDQNKDVVIQPYSSNTWYRFKIVADAKRGKYSIRVDGRPAVTDVPFRYSVANFAKFAASTAAAGTGSFYMDRLRVYPLGLLETDRPVVALAGNIRTDWTLGTPYAEPGYTAWSEYYGDLTPSVTVTGQVDERKEGTYELIYRVTDPDNRSSREAVRSVRVRSPLKLEPVSFGGTVYLNGSSVLELKAYVWHEEGGSIRLTASIGGAENEVFLPSAPSTKPSAPNAVWRWTGSELPEGRWDRILLSAAAGDALATAAAEGTLVVDTTAPRAAVQLANPDGTPYPEGTKSNGGITVTLSGEDGLSGSGLAGLRYRLNDGLWQTYREPFVLGTAGSHLLAVVAEDRAGNESETVTASVYTAKKAESRTVTAIRFVEPSYTLEQGAKRKLELAAVYEDGRTEPLHGKIEFASSHPNVASVNPGGHVTGKTPGQTVLTASYRGWTAQAELTVVKGTPRRE